MTLEKLISLRLDTAFAIDSTKYLGQPTGNWKLHQIINIGGIVMGMNEHAVTLNLSDKDSFFEHYKNIVIPDYELLTAIFEPQMIR
jgi:hypothetical protein